MKKLFLCFVMAAAISSCSKPYVIVQIADAQFGFTATEKCKQEGSEYNDDVKYEAECMAKAVAKVNEIRPDAVVFTGDQVHHAGNLVEVRSFKRGAAGISDDAKVFYLPGNHDIYIGMDEVNMAPFEEDFGKGSFVYESRKVKLIGLNTNYIKYNDPSENEQFEWLEASLGKNKGQTTLIFGHHPFFLEDIDEEDGYFQIQKNKRKVYFDMFSRHDVDAVFAGHLHDNASGEYKGIPSMTTTSVSRQLGGAQPSIRVITVRNGNVSSEILTLD